MGTKSPITNAKVSIFFVIALLTAHFFHKYINILTSNCIYMKNFKNAPYHNIYISNTIYHHDFSLINNCCLWN